MELLSLKLQVKETENLGRRGSGREYIFKKRAINDKQMTRTE